jgi:hypothetical protein
MTEEDIARPVTPPNDPDLDSWIYLHPFYWFYITNFGMLSGPKHELLKPWMGYDILHHN